MPNNVSLNHHHPVLILGATGTGKTRLAQQMHQDSKHLFARFYHVNIAAISAQLFESELFGHIKGSFTGAQSDKKGFCEQVDKGILFLDEIGELSLEQQAKLLTVIEQRVFYPVGSTRHKEFRGKFIFATNRNLPEMVSKGEFREDLYYRIRYFQVTLPKLIDNDLLGVITKILSNQNYVLDSKVWDSFLNYEWPGNYRELIQTLDYLAALEKPLIKLDDIPSWIYCSSHTTTESGNTFKNAIENFEKKFLKQALRKYQGKINLTSSQIGLNKVTLISKLKKYDIDRHQYKLEMGCASGF